MKLPGWPALALTALFALSAGTDRLGAQVRPTDDDSHQPLPGTPAGDLAAKLRGRLAQRALQQKEIQGLVKQMAETLKRQHLNPETAKALQKHPALQDPEFRESLRNLLGEMNAADPNGEDDRVRKQLAEVARDLERLPEAKPEQSRKTLEKALQNLDRQSLEDLSKALKGSRARVDPNLLDDLKNDPKFREEMRKLVRRWQSGDPAQRQAALESIRRQVADRARPEQPSDTRPDERPATHRPDPKGPADTPAPSPEPKPDATNPAGDPSADGSPSGGLNEQQLRDLARRMEKLPAFLRDSPTLQKRLGELIADGNRPAERSGGGLDRLAKLSRYGEGMGDYFKRHFRNNAPDRGRLPSAPSLPDLPSGGSSSSSPLQSGGAPDLPSASALPSAGTAEGIGSVALVLLLVGIGAAVVALAGWRVAVARSAARPLVPFPGPWPVNPATVADREQLIRAFDHLTLLRGGRPALAWNHRTAAAEIGDRPALRPAAEDLAALYETARYAPGGALPPEQLATARRHLRLLATKVPAA